MFFISVRSRGSLGDLGLLILAPYECILIHFSTVYSHSGKVSLSFLARSNTVFDLLVSRYSLMLKCWDREPQERPSFTDLVTIFDNLLSVAHVRTLV